MNGWLPAQEALDSAIVKKLSEVYGYRPLLAAGLLR
jgi:hypothetical protein